MITIRIISKKKSGCAGSVVGGEP